MFCRSQLLTRSNYIEALSLTKSNGLIESIAMRVIDQQLIYVNGLLLNNKVFVKSLRRELS